MKELSIEDKAKRFDEAYKKVEVRFGSNVADEIFFKESEDERIRKELLNAFQEAEDSLYMVLTPNRRKSFIAWLEKQGEKPQGKSALEAIKEEKFDNQNCVKPVDEVESKFKVGDWITNGDYTWKIIEVKPWDYILQSQNGNIVDDTISYVDEMFHSFTIQDAKDGDVLVDVYGNIGIFEQCDDFDWVSYCSLGHNGGFQHFKIEHENENTYPATKEQRDLLFQKMKEAGYKWDAEKKELKRISQEYPLTPDKCIKPACSEEDENRFNNLIFLVECSKENDATKEGFIRFINKLKSLIPQNNITDEELAKAKKDAYNDALEKIEYHSGEPTFDDGWSAAIWYLKKRNAQPQNSWKPSDEQMDQLYWWMSIGKRDGHSYKHLESLYNDLKKL